MQGCRAREGRGWILAGRRGTDRRRGARPVPETAVPAGVGAPVRRREDFRLLTGGGTFSDDVSLPAQLHAVMVRSAHAHARLASVDVSAAARAPGVAAVLTARDYAADGLRGIAHGANPAGAVDWRGPALVNRDGSAPFAADQPPIVGDRVRHAGEIVAAVVAETPEAARDAAELVDVACDPLPVVTGAVRALLPGAPVLHDTCPGNVAVDAEVGDAAAAEAAFSRAAHAVEAVFEGNRVVNCQMEPRAAVAAWEGGRLTLHAGGQGVHRHKTGLAEAFGLPPGRVRVVCRDVGGGFGPRTALYPEFVLCCWAARRLGRPVKWSGDRSEAFVSDLQARDLVVRAGLALDAEGGFLGLRADLIGNLGAHPVSFVPLANGPRLLSSVYRIGAIHARVRGALTNTVPTGPYRGAGRPEVMHAVERLIDIAAAETGFDRIGLRRRNMIGEDAFPAVTATGAVYDCGEFAACMDKALAAGRWRDFGARREEAARRGRLRGLGYASYIQAPVGAPVEHAGLSVSGDGAVTLALGTQSSGQGHETVFPQLVAGLLGVPADAVRLVTGDSDAVPAGGGTHSDRSMRLGGIVVAEAARGIVRKGAAVAERALEAAAGDIVYADGVYRVAGTDRAVGLFEAAARSEGGALSAGSTFRGRSPAHPNGAAVSEVEIDPETGVLTVVAHVAVDDPGRAVNPLVLEGQAHGAAAQAVGQALRENAVHDPLTGQPASGSFMDYALPRADDLPFFGTVLHEVPTAGNPLGVKGGGEGATVSGVAAFMNAVCDALGGSGARDVAMPAAPETLWRALGNGRPTG